MKVVVTAILCLVVAVTLAPTLEGAEHSNIIDVEKLQGIVFTADNRGEIHNYMVP